MSGQPRGKSGRAGEETWIQLHRWNIQRKCNLPAASQVAMVMAAELQPQPYNKAETVGEAQEEGHKMPTKPQGQIALPSPPLPPHPLSLVPTGRNDIPSRVRISFAAAALLAFLALAVDFAAVGLGLGLSSPPRGGGQHGLARRGQHLDKRYRFCQGRGNAHNA